VSGGAESIGVQAERAEVEGGGIEAEAE